MMRLHNLLRRLPQSRVPKRLLVSAALAGLCLTAASPRSALADNKVYPGSACQPLGDPDIEISADGAAGVENENTTQTRVVACPIVRDNTLNTNGTAADVWVYVYRDSSTGSQLSCTLHNTRPTDGSSFSSNSRGTTASGNVRLSIPLPSSTASGPYNLVCSLPPLSKVHAYVVPERSPTD